MKVHGRGAGCVVVVAAAHGIEKDVPATITSVSIGIIDREVRAGTYQSRT